MGFSTFVVTLLCLGAPPDGVQIRPLLYAQTTSPELVALPLTTEKVGAAQGLKAWKIVTRELTKARNKLKVSTKRQDEQHDFLVGPAREQAADCGANVECLTEIGTTLGADLLIAGKVSKAKITLFAIDVRAGKRIGRARSAKALSSGSVGKKARSAARGMVSLLSRKLRKSPEGDAAAGGKEPGPDDGTDSSGGKTDVATKTDPDKAPDTPPIGGQKPESSVDGTITIAKDQLRGVSRVTIDGENQSYLGDGSVKWSGAPGLHQVVAERLDGNLVTKKVWLRPKGVSKVALDFPEIDPRTAASTEGKRKRLKDKPVTSKWWFWTTLGVAVAAGATTAVVLAGGEKGGPSIPASSGSIRGTY